MTNEVLLQLSQGKINSKEALKQMYPVQKRSSLRRAHFIKLRIVIPEERGVTRFLAFLFLFPMPFFIVRMIFRFVKFDKEDIPFDRKQLFDMISIRGILINVNTKSGEKIFIKTI